MNIAIIPARGGSKRILRKNIKNFIGKPIIAYSIETALASNLFDEVMVSTDDEEIAEIAIKYGAKVPFYRSEKNSNDHASTMDVIEEVLSDYSSKLNQKFDSICCIYATAPLIKVNHLIDSYAKMQKEELTCVFPSLSFSYPIWRGLEISSNEKVSLLWPEHLNSRSQDLKPVFHDAGQWYWFSVNKLYKWEWPENSQTIVLSELEAQDIDNESDWKIAEMKYKLQL